jgi:hypothetical protein
VLLRISHALQRFRDQLNFLKAKAATHPLWPASEL